MFDTMGLKKDILKGIYSYGFERPSVIQQKGIVPLSKGYDIIAQAQSGTGKTGTFAIGMLERIDTTKDFTQGLVLAPTRELASQIFDVITELSKSMENVRLQLSIGGVSAIKHGRWETPKDNHIIIGTPGRVFDNIKRKNRDITHNFF